MKTRILLLSGLILHAAFGSRHPNVPKLGFAHPMPGFVPPGAFAAEDPHFEYDILGWLVGDPDTTRFRSHIRTDSEWDSFVVVDRPAYAGDSRRRYTLDFDSLKARRAPTFRQKAGFGGLEHPDTVWIKAARHGKKWVFPLFPGRAGIFGLEPAGAYVYMDTGSGLVEYSEDGYRKHLGRDSAAAAILKTWNLVNKAYLRAIEAYDAGSAPRPQGLRPVANP